MDDNNWAGCYGEAQPERERERERESIFLQQKVTVHAVTVFTKKKTNFFAEAKASENVCDCYGCP